MGNNKLPTAVEMPIELWANDKIITTFMGSPYDLEDLAIGHLLTRGMIDDIDEILDIKVNTDTYQIFVYTSNPVLKQLYSVPEFILSGTSSVNKFSENIYKISSIESNYSIELDKIVHAIQFMVDNAAIYNTTGGVHSAILAHNDKYYLREDIGRHSAVDKAIGAAAKEKVDFSNSFICTSGRISLDMLLKSAAVRLPVIGSLKYPSDMGVNLANHYKIAIVSKALSKNPLIYANINRIINNERS